MGILTDPTTSQKYSILITKYSNKATLLTYLCGILWFLILAFKPYNANTYFSENALLPGLVQGEFLHERNINNYYEDLKEEIKDHPSDMPTAWLLAKFNQLGFDAYTHNFTLHYPLGKQTKYYGKNVYAILRAPRAGSTEAIVLTSPYRISASLHPDVLPGIALLMGMAKFFAQKTFWAKDIIFLITAHEQIGMQAWLDAYHHTSTSPVLHSSELLGRSGAIQAAINLEVLSDKVTSFDIKVEGLNGQLPNLDLFNLVVRLCSKEGIPVTFHEEEDPANDETESFSGFLKMLKTMLKMVRSQASGIPNGNHGLFLRYHIEAITLVGQTKRGPKYSFLVMGRIVEGIFRSLNNLLEKFHQSFFFYLLPATNSYVSIGMYMPAFGLILAGTVIKALAYWLECTNDEEIKIKNLQKNNQNLDNENGVILEERNLNCADKNNKETSEKEIIDNKNSKTSITESKPEAIADTDVDYSLISVVPYFTVTHILGVLLYISPQYICQLGNDLNVDSMHSVFYGASVITVCGLLLPLFCNRKLLQIGNYPVNWKILKCLGLIELAIVLGSVSLINFSLALLASVFYIPACVCLQPTRNKIKTFVQLLLIFILSPLAFLYLIILVDRLFSGMKIDVASLQMAFLGTERALLYSIVDDYIYGNWIFSVTSTIIFPNWLIFWCLLWTKSTN